MIVIGDWNIDKKDLIKTLDKENILNYSIDNSLKSLRLVNIVESDREIDYVITNEPIILLNINYLKE